MLIGVDTGQREADVLALPTIAAQRGPDGRITLRLRQSKRRRSVAVDLTPRLHCRVDAILIRRPANADDPALILSEETGRRYKLDNFRHWFGRVRQLAATGDDERGLPSCLSLAPQLADTFAGALAAIANAEPPPLERDIADLRAMAAKPKAWRARVADWRATFQDLRDTTVTRLAVAGCTIPQIASVTGQSERSIHALLPHYLALSDAIARDAIQQLVDHEADAAGDAWAEPSDDGSVRAAIARLAALEASANTRH